MPKYYLYLNEGFLTGDTTTAIVEYAYPYSPYAHKAKAQPHKVARIMLEKAWRPPPTSPDYLRLARLDAYHLALLQKEGILLEE